MASTPEGKVKKALDKMLKEFAPELWYYSPQAGIYGVSGVPDRIACYYGKFYGLECKRDRLHEMTDLQSQCRDKIMAAGGVHYVIYDATGIEHLRTHFIAIKARERLTVNS